MFFYNPLELRCKSHMGAIACGSEVTFRIYQGDSGEGNFSADVCYFVLYADGQGETVIPMDRTDDGFEVTLKFNEIGLFFYYFAFPDYVFLGRGAQRCAVLTDHPESWQITVYEKSYRTPEWFKGGVMYQIFPDRFHKVGESSVPPHKILRDDWGGCPSYLPNEYGKILNNDFFGGNLNGITAKLDYLKSLGVTTVYLNPIFEAYSNHRYDTGDYMKIDPLLGSIEDFDRLIADAEKRGIRLVLDGVFNHTGDDSRYFNKYGRYDSVGAYQSKESPYADWYDFHEFPATYRSWWGIETLPETNEQSKSYQEFILGDNGVVKNWLSHGIGGYRLDVADELPGFFLQKMRKTVKESDPDAILIGEVWEDASNKISYDVRREYLQGRELDSVMNYPLKNAIIHYLLTENADELRETIAMIRDNYPKQTVDALMNILGTHDTPRILTVLGGKQCADKREMAKTSLSDDEKQCATEKLRMAALLQFTLPGVPCIYYGDEIGMEGYSDPFCRRCFPWENEKCDLNAFYQKLGKIRTEQFPEVFKDGEYREIFAENGCIVFARKKGKKSLFVFCNNSRNYYTVKLRGAGKELLSETHFTENYTIKPYSYGILVK